MKQFNKVKQCPKPAPEPGIYHMDFGEYRDIDALNASTIQDFLISPRRGAYGLQCESGEPTKAMLFGTALHARILEPEDYAARAMQTELGPGAEVGHRKLQEEHPDAIILRAGWGDDIEAIARELEHHPRASDILREKEAQKEITIVWSERMKFDGEVYELPCKARLDFYSPAKRCVFDLKKVRQDGGEQDAFSKAIWNNGYYVQAAWYARATQKAGLCDKRPAYGWICVEETPPYEIDIFQASEDLMYKGWQSCLIGMRLYGNYRLTGRAPGRQIRIEEIDLPKWVEGK